jgi:hypothetical protein
MYSVYQPWDPLKICVVGRSYPPEFYSFIDNPRLRALFEKIAIETEEDYQKLIVTLTNLGVRVIRPNVPSVCADDFVSNYQRIPGPISMVPRDQMIMVGEKFFVFPYDRISVKSSGRNIPRGNWTEDLYHRIKGPDWPQAFTPYEKLPLWIQDECHTILKIDVCPGEDFENFVKVSSGYHWWSPITSLVQAAGNPVIQNQHHAALNCIPANGVTQIGKDLYFGISNNHGENTDIKNLIDDFFQDYRCHLITSGGHIDGCFNPVIPGLIISTRDISTYQSTFPGWQVVFLPGESYGKLQPFLDLKKKNQGKWWIKGSEYDHELIDYVETWLGDWVGYVEESVFDVNCLTVDTKNVIVSSYNSSVFDTFDQHGITAHICPLRHRYFWDGGIHCVTLDIDRDGYQQDWFPDRSR